MAIEIIDLQTAKEAFEAVFEEHIKKKMQHSTSQLDKFVTVETIANYCEISKDSVRRNIVRYIPSYKIGGGKRYKWSEVIAFINLSTELSTEAKTLIHNQKTQ